MDFLQLQANVLSAETIDSSGSSLQYQRNFNLIGAPTKFTRFTAMYSQTGVNDQDNISKGAVMELMPLANTKVSAGYTCMDSAGLGTLQVIDYAAASKLCPFLSFSGNYRSRLSQDNSTPDTSAVSLALAPVKACTLTAGYKCNPEDPSGAVQDQKAATVGMNVGIGRSVLPAVIPRQTHIRPTHFRASAPSGWICLCSGVGGC